MKGIIFTILDSEYIIKWKGYVFGEGTLGNEVNDFKDV